MTATARSLTNAQCKAIFAAARVRGLDIDAVRAMTPNGSISKLTVAEAARVLDRLNGNSQATPGSPRPARPRRRSGHYALASDEQRELIDQIRSDLGWSPEKLTGWLAKRHYRSDRTRAMSQMDSSADAGEVIELLKGVRVRHYQAEARKAAAIEEAPY